MKFKKTINVKELTQRKELIKPASLKDYLTSVEVVLRGITVKHDPGDYPKDPLRVQMGRIYTSACDITSIFVEHDIIKEFRFTGKLDELIKNELRRNDKLKVYFYPVDEATKEAREIKRMNASNAYEIMSLCQEEKGYYLRGFNEVETPIRIKKIENGETTQIYPK